MNLDDRDSDFDAEDERRMFVANLKNLLNEAEGYAFVGMDAQREYLHKAAAFLHLTVDLFGDEKSRWIASDASDRAGRWM
jgi:hypothetical protein